MIVKSSLLNIGGSWVPFAPRKKVVDCKWVYAIY